MILFTAMVFSGLAFKIKREVSPISIKTIKNWKFYALIVINALFTVLAGILFIPINFFLYDINLYNTYYRTLGYIDYNWSFIFVLYGCDTIQPYYTAENHAKIFVFQYCCYPPVCRFNDYSGRYIWFPRNSNLYFGGAWFY